MSQDLLAEFGSFAINDVVKESLTPLASEVNPRIKPVIQNQQSADFLNGPTEEDAWAEDDEDDFGDFEVAGQEALRDVFEEDPVEASTSETTRSTHPASTSKPKDPAGNSKPTYPPVTKKPTYPPATKKQTHPTGYSKPAVETKSVVSRSGKTLPSSHPFASNPDVLFDAEDSDDLFEPMEKADADDDDFGDFESTELPPILPKASTVQAKQSATFDLLGLDDGDQPPPSLPAGPVKVTKPIAAKQSTTSARKDTPKSRVQAPLNETNTLVPDEDFAEWDDFESAAAQNLEPGTAPTTPAPAQTSTTPTNQIKLPTETIGNLLLPAPNTPPAAPTTIPPPSILLSLFPPLLKETSTTFLTPLASLPQAEKTIFLSAPTTQEFLKSYLAAAHVLAHIIAGRKSRWKRDKFLAQSMRIGPSVSGRSGGMKLAGLDANESRREDAGVEDVVGVWREQSGRLRSAVTAASAGAGAGASASVRKAFALPVVPEMAAVMPVRVGKTAEGAVVGTVACALCGLKREERVAKVDVEVEDSFGEWWIEKTNMHVSCWNFWEAHKESLRGR